MEVALALEDGTIKDNFVNQSKQVVLLFSSRHFLKDVENMFFVFLSCISRFQIVVENSYLK